MKILIIGGVAGGMSAATRLRRLDETAEIIVLEKGPYVSFANCGMPYYVSGEILEHNDLLVQTPDALRARFNLDVRPNNEVIAIHPDRKTVTIQGDTLYEESYDKLILSPGGKPIIPTMEGYDEATNIFGLRSITDVDKVMDHIEKHHPQKAVVIGGGFIGIEMAESLRKIGIEVTVVEMAPQILPPLDIEMAAIVEHELVRHGIRVITNMSATALADYGKKIVLNDGTVIESDLTILSVGVRPESALAEKAGIKLGMRSGILVDENYETSIKDIYAVGDAIVVNNQITNTETMIALANPANRQGRQVADAIMGKKNVNKGSIGTAIVRVFDIAAGQTGLTERMAKMNNLNVKVVHTAGNHHAGYLPGAHRIDMKLVFNPETGAIYGGQAVGKSGVDKRIDVLATAIKGHLTIFDLPELELAYAPPFNSAKDPINMIGYAAMNVAEGLSDTIQWYELDQALADGKVLIDVRDANELLSDGRFRNAIHIELNDLRNKLATLDKSKEYIVSCYSGQRSYTAERLLRQHGFKVSNLDGAFRLYNIVKPEEIIHD